MAYIIEGCEPKSFFHYFEEISKIPRSSGNEKAISDFLVAFASNHHLECYQDEIYNIIIKKQGSNGYETKPAVMIQGHLDMVCEKNNDTIHDFDKDSLKLFVENGYLYADGTTLGADNGVAVALMMALLSDNNIAHPPLECVFTVQEETGLLGAKMIDGNKLSAKTMINLDSEEEGVATVSCAGGMRVRFHKKNDYETVSSSNAIQISVRGLVGGHSGMDIHLGHENSNKIMGRILHELYCNTDMRLVNINGGSKDNAIPRECDVVVNFINKDEYEKGISIIKKQEEEIFEEISSIEKNFCVKVSHETIKEQLSKEMTADFIKFIFITPNGVKVRNIKAGGFVIASINMGVIKTKEDEICITFSPRSSVASLQEQTKQELRLLADTFHFEMSIDSEYPGWKYAEKSRIRDIFKESFQQLFSKELKVEAIHAGLECGLFIDKLGELDAIAIGPNIYNCHTPKESLDLASCERTWQLMVDVLRKL